MCGTMQGAAFGAGGGPGAFVVNVSVELPLPIVTVAIPALGKLWAIVLSPPPIVMAVTANPLGTVSSTVTFVPTGYQMFTVQVPGDADSTCEPPAEAGALSEYARAIEIGGVPDMLQMLRVPDSTEVAAGELVANAGAATTRATATSAAAMPPRGRDAFTPRIVGSSPDGSIGSRRWRHD